MVASALGLRKREVAIGDPEPVNELPATESFNFPNKLGAATGAGADEKAAGA